MRFTTKIITAVACLGFGLGAVAAQAEPIGTERLGAADMRKALADNRDVDTLINDGVDKYDNQDYKGAREDFEKALSRPESFNLDPQRLAATYYLLAFCDYFLDDYAEALKHLKVVETMNAPDLLDGPFYIVKSDSCFVTNDDQCGVESFVKSITIEPKMAEGTSLRHIYSLYNQVDELDDNGKLKFEFLNALWGAKYTDPDKIESVDWLWSELFKLYVAKGDMVKAKQILGDIKTASSLIGLQSDKRYRPKLEAFGYKVDIQGRLDATLSDSKKTMEQSPKKVRAAYSYGVNLLNSGRFEETLTLVDAIISKINAAPESDPPYEDLADSGNWIFDLRASALWQLGRFDEALKAAITARDYSLKHGKDTVSQVINLGGYYYELERSQEALDSVKDIKSENVSPYGTMNAMEIRVCAYAQMGDLAHQKEGLDYMLSHAEDGFPPLKYALLCANDQARLAEILVSRLDDEKTRNATLLEVQHYLLPKFETPFEAKIRTRYEAVLARPEVKAAIEKYGYVESYPMYNLFH